MEGPESVDWSGKLLGNRGIEERLKMMSEEQRAAIRT
jgi:hypothetical protein